jgi:hypothetical protein
MQTSVVGEISSGAFAVLARLGGEAGNSNHTCPGGRGKSCLRYDTLAAIAPRRCWINSRFLARSTETSSDETVMCCSLGLTKCQRREGRNVWLVFQTSTLCCRATVILLKALHTLLSKSHTNIHAGLISFTESIVGSRSRVICLLYFAPVVQCKLCLGWVKAAWQQRACLGAHPHQR